MQSARDQMLTAVAAVAVLVGFWWLVVGPQQARIRTVRDQIERLNDSIAERQQQGRHARAAQTELTKCGNRLARYEQRIPRTQQLGVFLERLSGLARKTGLSDENYTPRTVKSVGELGILPIEMTFRSDFGSLHSFLKELETMDRHVWVQSVETERVEPGSPMLTTQMTLQIFFEAD